jgi:integrase
LVQAGLSSPRDAALASLLALNGLRISEALNVNVDDLDHDRGHRTLKIVRKGGKHVVVPLAPRTSRVLDLYLGERVSGPVFLGAGGARMDRYGRLLCCGGSRRSRQGTRSLPDGSPRMRRSRTGTGPRPGQQRP